MLGFNRVMLPNTADKAGTLQVEIGSKVDLPFWLARDLGIRDAVNLALPSCFNQRCLSHCRPQVELRTRT